MAGLEKLVADAKKVGEAQEVKGRDHIKAYHYLSANVEVAGQTRAVIVTVRELTDGRAFYDLSMDNGVGTRTQGPMGAREARVEPDMELGADTLNLRFAEAPVNTDTAMTPMQARAVNAAAVDELARVGLLGKIGLKVEAGRLVGPRGTYSRGVISILRNRGKGWRHTLDHEIVHALRDPARWGGSHGLFTADEWRALVQAARADAGLMARVRKAYFDMDPAAQMEEAVAEMFADWAAGRREVDGGPLRAAFETIRSFFRAVASALRGEGFVDAARIMERIAAGEIGGRGPDGNGGGQPRSADGRFVAQQRGKDPEAPRRTERSIASLGDLWGDLAPSPRRDGTNVGGSGGSAKEQRGDTVPLSEVIAAARRPGHAAQKAETGTAAGWVLAAARSAGVEMAGLRHVIDGSAVRHIFSHHGNARAEAKRGQISITEADIAQIGAVIGDPDAVAFGTKTRIGREAVTYIKAMADGTVLLVEEIRQAKGEAAVNTMWKKMPAAKDAYALGRILLSNVRNDGGTDIKVFAKDDSVKEQRDMRDGQDGDTTPHQEQRLARGVLDTATAWAKAAGKGGKAVAAEARGDFAVAARDVAGFARRLPSEIRRRGISEGLSNALTDAMAMGEGGKNSILALVPSRALFSELGAKLPSAARYLRTKEDMDSLRNEWANRADETIRAWRKLLADPVQNAALMDLMHDATLAGVDPSERFEARAEERHHDVVGDPTAPDALREWAQGVIENDKRREASYVELSKRFNALPADHQAMFRTVRDEYGALADAHEQAVLENVRKSMQAAARRAQDDHDAALRDIAANGLKGAALTEAKREARDALTRAKARAAFATRQKIAGMRARFEANRLEGPYFPLTRFGDYFATLRDAKGRPVSFSRFETRRALNQFVKEHEGGPLWVEKGVLSNADQLKGAVDPGFVAEIEAMLGDAGVSTEVMDQVWQRWLETLPDMSIRKNRIHRKGTEGFNKDAFRGFARQMFHGGHQLARLTHGVDLEETLVELREEAAAAPDPVRAGLVVNEMNRRHHFAMNPTGGAGAPAITSAAFVWYLAMSPAAAMVNLSQTTILGPALMKAAFPNQSTGAALRELTRALGDFTSGVGQTASSKRLTADERKAMEEAYRRGTIDKSQAHDLAGIAETGVEYNDARSRWMARLSWTFHHAERMNREVTFLAAYRMARADGSDADSAIQRASDLTWKVHFDYQNSSKPRFMQGDAAKVLFTFRNFTVNMLWRLFRDGHQAMMGETEAARKEARSQILGISASMMIHAGIRGTWGYGLLMMLAGMFFAGGDDEAEEELKKLLVGAEGAQGFGAALRRNIGGMMLNGAPTHLTGLDLTNRLGMANLWFRDSGRIEEGRDAYRSLLEQIAGPGIGLVLGTPFLVGKDTADGHYDRALEGAVPKFVRDGLKAGRYLSEGVLTRKGDEIVPEVSVTEAIAQASGFTPAKVAERYEANSRMMNKQDRIVGRRSGIQKAAGDAILGGRPVPPEVQAQIRTFNSDYPEYPITAATIRQSVNSRRAARDRNEFGIALNPKLNRRIRDEQAGMIYD